MSTPPLPYAGIASRAVALALDVLIADLIVLFGGAMLALVGSLVGEVQLDTFGKLVALAAWAAVIVTYFVFFWSSTGQTPGMRALGLRVTTGDGRRSRGLARPDPGDRARARDRPVLRGLPARCSWTTAAARCRTSWRGRSSSTTRPPRRRSAAVLERIDAWQRRHGRVAFVVGVVKKFGEDRASSHAALMSYYAFLSLFPLLLAFVSILGFVLEDDPALQKDIVDSTLARIPVVGAQLGDEVEPLTGSSVALVIGLVGALWAGLGVTLAMGRAFDEIWDIPRLEQRGPFDRRGRAGAVLVILACALVAATVAGGLAIGGRIGPAAQRAGTLAVTLLVNAVVLLAAFWLLTARARRLPDLLPGVLIAAAGLLALQAAGGWYVARVIDGAGDTYGTFALVIGLLSWFWLGGHLLLFAAEVNVVRLRRLWPRSLTGELEPADRAAMRRYAGAARYDVRQTVTVTFDDED